MAACVRAVRLIYYVSGVDCRGRPGPYYLLPAPPRSCTCDLPLRLSGVRQVPKTPNPKTPQTQKTPNNINVMALAGSPRSKSHHHHRHQQQQQMGRVCFNDPYHVCPLSGGLVIDCTLSEMQSHLSSQVHNLQYMYTVPPPSECTCHLPSLLFRLHICPRPITHVIHCQSATC